MTRTGFTVEPGCGLIDASLLPDSIELPMEADARAWTYAGQAWYGGATTSLQFYSSTYPGWTSFQSGYHFGSWVTTTQVAWSIPELEGEWLLR